MRGFLINRLIRTIVVLFGLSLLVFVLLNASGDPAAIMAPADATPAVLERLRADFGVDQPIYVQYARFVSKAITGDFGTSWKYRQPAMELIWRRFPATLELALAATAIVLVVGVPLGVLSATQRGGWLDLASTGLTLVSRAMPSFWLGLMFILIFAVMLGWLPTSGRGDPRHIIMPAVTLALAFMADTLLLVRAGVLEVLDEDYIRTARAKGLAERGVLLGHALRNAMIPVVSVIGIQFAHLLGGAIVTETVFSWPGIGSLAVEALSARDFPLVQASVFLLAVCVGLVTLGLDLCYGVIDPRIRRA